MCHTTSINKLKQKFHAFILHTKRGMLLIRGQSLLRRLPSAVRHIAPLHLGESNVIQSEIDVNSTQYMVSDDI